MILKRTSTPISQFCQRILPYALGVVVFMILVFSLYVHSLPPKISKDKKQTINANTNNAGNRGVTFEEAMYNAEVMNGAGSESDEDVVNLDGDSL